MDGKGSEIHEYSGGHKRDLPDKAGPIGFLVDKKSAQINQPD